MKQAYIEALEIVRAQYDEAYRKAEEEWERYGDLSEATHRRLAGVELEMELMGI